MITAVVNKEPEKINDDRKHLLLFNLANKDQFKLARTLGILRIMKSIRPRIAGSVHSFCSIFLQKLIENIYQRKYIYMFFGHLKQGQTSLTDPERWKYIC